MPIKKKINLEQVGIRLTESSYHPSKLVPYFVVSSSQPPEIVHSIDEMEWFDTCGQAYNAIVSTAEWKALNPKVRMLMWTSNTVEFCSEVLKKPEDILRELHKVFESPVLDKYIETLSPKHTVDVSRAIRTGITLHSSPKGKQVLDQERQVQVQEKSAAL